MDKKYLITVIILTYNPIWEKLRNTIKSIIVQQNINLQIIIADDCSVNNLSVQTEKYFQELNFTDYQFIRMQTNGGTVKNINNVLDTCEGDYIKLISPGDLLYNESVLYDWIKEMDCKRAEISFGNAVYYENRNEKIHILKMLAHPQDISIYRYNNRKLRKNYLIYDDIWLGAATLCKANSFKKYIKMLVGKVVYAEDHINRLMVLCNEPVHFFNKNIIFYEYGTGVSTSKNNEWKKKLQTDWESADTIISELLEKESSSLKREFKQICFCKASNHTVHKIKKFFFIKGLLFWKIKFHFNKRWTDTDISLDETIFKSINWD